MFMPKANLVRPRFDPLQAIHMAHSLSLGDGETAKQVAGDWRSFLHSHFDLTDDQRKWLDSVSPEQESQVQQVLQDTFASRGSRRIVIVMVADNSKPGGLVHELRQESVGEEEQMRANLVIAHCDANCRNWGWGAAP
jgi:hypothetical protein